MLDFMLMKIVLIYNVKFVKYKKLFLGIVTRSNYIGLKALIGINR